MTDIPLEEKGKKLKLLKCRWGNETTGRTSIFVERM